METSFVSLFADQCLKTPDNIAIVFEERQLSYQQLDHLSDQYENTILQFLAQSTGQPPKEINVGLCIDKSPEVIAAMLGVLKAGAAFVPLDPELPVDRIAYMVNDANINIIIAQPDYQNTFADSLSSNQKIKWIDCYQSSLEEFKSISLQENKIEINSNDLAYIMYTSGSTGKPKGVQIEHQALVTYCIADIDVYKVNENDRTLQFSTINFDIAIEEIFPPLLMGSSIVIRPAIRSDQLNELSSIINQYQVTAVHIATAYWHEWVDLMVSSNDQIPSSLRLMVVTGEKVSTQHYQRWKTLCLQGSKDKESTILWCNAYGPTEATVSASVFIPDANFKLDNMPIGKPLKDYSARIVDENNNDVSGDNTGQLLIGGPALARGYLNRPELNKEVFINLPVQGSKNNKVERLYKTGDLARWLANGDIEFAGRIDHQIKLGSYRIEPGEVEVAINQHDAVLESLIIFEEVDNKKSLIAYVAHGENKLTAQELSQFLNTYIPSYMVPARYVFLDHFPKTINGKIDRKALPNPSLSVVPRSTDYIAPRNDLEQRLAQQWQDVLQIPEVGIHDDFFALGGSSLLAVGVVARLIRSINLELPVRDFFANPTIASMAKHIQYLQGGALSDDDAESDSKILRARLPLINPVFFKSGKNKLFGVHYQPPQPPQSDQSQQKKYRNHAVLICHPLGHEYPRSYRNLQQLAIQLGRAGYDTLRFDYASTGNSQGDSVDLTMEQCSFDIITAADYLRKQSGCEYLSIIAVRMGAPLAIKADVGNIENMILWDPVIEGKTFLNLLERLHKQLLIPMSRFTRFRRASKIDQLYGHKMSKTKRASITALNVPFNAQTSAQKQYVISSTNYLQDEDVNKEDFSSYQHLITKDDIYWHDADYTESAFASPDFYTQVHKLLENSPYRQAKEEN